MKTAKIVVIGAGSASFGLNTLATLLRNKALKGCQLSLVDQEATALELAGHLAQRLNREWDAEMNISTHTHHADALEGGDFVILSIEAPPRERLWQLDYEIPLKYGVRQPYAENGGPGGFAHTLRNIQAVLQIVQDMQQLCPQAWLINFTNPMMRICDLIARYSAIKVVGLCHQIMAGYAMVGKALASDLGITVPLGFSGCASYPQLNEIRAQVARETYTRVEIRAAGINHFTWMLSLKLRESGEDLYPLFTRRWQELEAEFEPLTRQVFHAFGTFPISGDEHLCEYLPWVHNPLTRPWVKYDLTLYDWQTWAGLRHSRQETLARMAHGLDSIEPLRNVSSEGAAEIIEGLLEGTTIVLPAINLPNSGQIENLPHNSIVETPGVIENGSLRAQPMGSLPQPIAELCRREITCGQLCVDAGVYGDRKKALQSLLLSPTVDDLEVAEKMLEDYLSAYRPWLPQFWM